MIIPIGNVKEMNKDKKNLPKIKNKKLDFY